MATIFLTNIILAVVTVAAVVAVFVILIIRGKSAKLPWFKEIVRSRKAKETFFAIFQPRSDLDRLTDHEIDKLVTKYLSAKGQEEGPWQLLRLGERAIPSLLKALEDPRNLIRPSGGNVSAFAKSGVEVALSALGRSEHPEIIPLLENFASHEDYHIRHSAAFHLGKYPTECTLPLISTLIEDANDHVRAGIFIGLRHAINEKRLTPEIRRSLASRLGSAIVSETGFFCSETHPAALLLDLDSHAATKLLTTPAALDPSNPGVPDIIEILSQKGIPIPDDLLQKLLRSTEQAPLDGKSAVLRGELLKAMAGVGHPEAESLILHTLSDKSPPQNDAETARPSGRLKELAGEALCIVLGIRDPISRADQLIERARSEGRSEPQVVLNVMVVADLDAEVFNGGFDQYFFNNSGDSAASVVPALKAINAPEHAEIMNAICELFGLSGPSPQREGRHRQLEVMSETHRKRMGALEKEWYAKKLNLRHLLHLYCAANADAFK